MGMSDPYIYSKYLEMLNTIVSPDELANMDACFLGFRSGNSFTKATGILKSTFYDLEINNWNINDEDWKINKESFDIVIATRVAYFAKSPVDIVRKCHHILKDNGILLIDWGLGDHWRFKDYKVGWVKNGEQEHAYRDDNFLWSTIWDDLFQEHPAYIKFSQDVEKKGYSDVRQSIMDEVPSVGFMSEIQHLFDFKVDMLTLWENSPQLYIVLAGVKA